MSRSFRPCAALLALLAAVVPLAGACTGPTTVIDNPHDHRVFVDGALVATSTLPFRYYGVSRWDALPKDLANSRPDWALQPASEAIDLPPPASLWLFPVDLPLELLRRTLYGREDVTTRIVLPPTPAAARVDAEVPPIGQVELLARARAARLAR